MTISFTDTPKLGELYARMIELNAKIEAFNVAIDIVNEQKGKGGLLKNMMFTDTQISVILRNLDIEVEVCRAYRFETTEQLKELTKEK